MEPRRPPSSTEVERRLKADRGTAMAMATERKFSRFATSDRSLQTREIPEGGICLSAFLVISQTGHPERVLMGHLNPNGPWDHIEALDAERAEMNSKGWMLPSSHLMLGESPQGADGSIQPLRSEEHTSELQSQSNLVCRLLLEKKKKKQLQHRETVLGAHSIRTADRT